MAQLLAGTLYLRFAAGARPVKVDLEAREGPSSPWRRIGSATGDALALTWPAAWRDGGAIVTQLRMSLHFQTGGAPVKLTRVLLYPSAPLGRASP